MLLSCNVCIDHAMYALIMKYMYRSDNATNYVWIMISSMVIWSQCDVHVTSSMT